MAVKYGRHLEDQLTIASGRIRTARRDSLAREQIYQADIAGYEQRIEWLQDQLPRWYEKPTVLITTTALLTIWAVLRAVKLSM